jgi:hypothetical protein
MPAVATVAAVAADATGDAGHQALAPIPAGTAAAARAARSCLVAGTRLSGVVSERAGGHRSRPGDDGERAAFGASACAARATAAAGASVTTHGAHATGLSGRAGADSPIPAGAATSTDATGRASATKPTAAAGDGVRLEAAPGDGETSVVRDGATLPGTTDAAGTGSGPRSACRSRSRQDTLAAGSQLTGRCSAPA